MTHLELPVDVQAHFDEVKARLLARAAAQEAAEREKRTDDHRGSGQKGTSVPADPISQGNIVERLVRRFGMGDRPDLRAKFYSSVDKLASKYGQAVLDLVSVAAVRAASARQPGRYFVACFKVLAAEKGYVLEAATVKSDSW